MSRIAQLAAILNVRATEVHAQVRRLNVREILETSVQARPIIRNENGIGRIRWIILDARGLASH